ncbi:hypothetical protein ACJMK2_040639 [Sinanodonta woodiana]|uniref:EF-hand domain-containing protein n=1 Tax=Sinanodonta woodiana TaxID=1069815 RepID=A0ABD3W1P6_SINWO
MGIYSSRARKAKHKKIRKLMHRIGGKVTDEAIQEWRETYKSHLKSGSSAMTRDDFHRVFTEYYNGDSRTFSDHIFRSFDVNRDGYVDFKEFLVGLYVSGCKDPRRKQSWAFRVYDVDGNGKIGKVEMTSVINAILRLTSQRYIRVNPAKLVDEFFSEADKDHVGFLDLEKFIHACQKMPVMMDILQCDPSARAVKRIFISRTHS